MKRARPTAEQHDDPEPASKLQKLNAMAQTQFSGLEADLFFLIGRHLSLHHFLNLGSTCTQVHAAVMAPSKSWLLLAQVYFPFSSSHHELVMKADVDIKDWLQKAAVHERTAGKTSATTFSIVHLDGRYWELKDTTESPFGKIAHLNTVCWGEFSGRVCDDLPAGKYDIIWRMRWPKSQARKVHNPCYTFSWKDCQAPEKFQYATGEYPLCHVASDNWFLWNMGTLNFAEDVKEVNVHYFGDCPWWFGGWDVDWVSLAPCAYSPLMGFTDGARFVKEAPKKGEQVGEETGSSEEESD